MLEEILDAALAPAHFFAGPDLTLAWDRQPRQERPWEIFRGQLLSANQTRASVAFEEWNVFRVEADERSDEPLLSLKLDRAANVVHITRAIHCHAWEGYHAGDNVYLSRETQRWVNELVGSVPLARFPDEHGLRDELAGLLFQAVVGVSRLPLTSVEAPLPDFSLGRLGYFPQQDSAAAGPLRTPEALLEQVLTAGRTASELSRLVELLIRATPTEKLAELAPALAARWFAVGYSANDFVALLRRLFDEVALSPHTGFIDRTLGLLPRLIESRLLTPETMLDFLGYLLRHLARHLTAYDLITFHHQGANYPDALLLDAALKMYLHAAETTPEQFLPAAEDAAARAARKCRRRRGLRQAWLLRRFYEGLPVPDAPTSPGENQRILPSPHVRVPEEQFDPEKRTRRLYADDPLLLGAAAHEVLRQALHDLALPDELRELGTAIFLDRPLGAAKPPGEPDRTLLVALEGFSRKIAGKRLDLLAEKAEGLVTPEALGEARSRLRGLEVKGIDLPFSRGGGPGKVALDDVRKVAFDFVFICTTQRSLAEFLAQFDFTPLRQRGCLDFLAAGRRVVMMRGEAGGLAIYDTDYRKRLELEVDGALSYETRGGREVPVAGLRVRGAWDAAGAAIADLTGFEVRPTQI
jgi:hypothetical protein